MIAKSGTLVSHKLIYTKNKKWKIQQVLKILLLSMLLSIYKICLKKWKKWKRKRNATVKMQRVYIQIWIRGISHYYEKNYFKLIKIRITFPIIKIFKIYSSIIFFCIQIGPVLFKVLNYFKWTYNTRHGIILI